MVFCCGYKRAAGKFSKCYGGYYREYSVNAKVARAIKTVFYSSKIGDNPSFKCDHQYLHQTITHPEERIWAEQTSRQQLRSPDAPKIKHNRMKQFYMVDMGQKM